MKDERSKLYMYINHLINTHTHRQTVRENLKVFFLARHLTKTKTNSNNNNNTIEFTLLMKACHSCIGQRFRFVFFITIKVMMMMTIVQISRSKFLKEKKFFFFIHLRNFGLHYYHSVCLLIFLYHNKILMIVYIIIINSHFLSPLSSWWSWS